MALCDVILCHNISYDTKPTIILPNSLLTKQHPQLQAEPWKGLGEGSKEEVEGREEAEEAQGEEGERGEKKKKANKKRKCIYRLR